MTTTSGQANTNLEPARMVAAEGKTTDSSSVAGNEERSVFTLGEICGVIGVTEVAAVATCSLALAQLGRHDGWFAVGLGTALTAALAGLAWAYGGRRRIRVDVAELGLLAAVVVVGAFFFLPGFHYAWNDKDPGVYVIHGIAIARDGDVYIDDPVLERGIRPAFDQAGRFPGLWLEPGHPTEITGQFYHLYSSLLATAHDIGGPRALFNLNPLLAVGSVCLLVLATRRAAGILTATLAGGFLVTSMMQVWQAKYPSTEMVAQVLLAGTLLAAILAIRRRWTGGAFLAGLLTGVGFLARPDGFLYVLLGVGIAALAIAADRADRRVAAFFVGLSLTFPYAVWNAYDARELYSASADVPAAATLVGAMVAAIAAGFTARAVVRSVRARKPHSPLADPARLLDRWHVPLGVVSSLVMGTSLVLLFYRREIWGEDYQYLVFTDRVERSFDEVNMQWFAWFFTIRGLVVMWIGFCVVTLRRWRASLFVLVMPGALLLPLYLYDAKVSMRLMWWVRRFIPAVVPAVILLIAIALAWALTRRLVIVKLVGAVAAVSLLVEYAHMSWPLRHHDEMAGSWDISAAIASTAGDDQGVFLFPGEDDIYSVNRNAPGTVWLVFDQVAARLPADYDFGDLQSYQRAFPERPVFLVAPGTQLPEQLPSERFSKVREVIHDVVIWEETREHRPAEDVTMPMGVTVWRIGDGRSD